MGEPKSYLFVLIFALSLTVIGCSRDKGPAQDEAKLAGKTPADFPQASEDYFRDMDGGIELTEDEIKGRNTWMIWTGGNEAFWDYLSNNSFGTFDLLKALSSYPCSDEQGDYARNYPKEEQASYSYDATGGDYSGEKKPYYSYYDRDTRFEYLGLMNEPGFRRPTKPDQHGLCLDERTAPPEPFDEAVYGKASGVLGLRLYPNPNFNEQAAKDWDANKFYTDPKYFNNPDLVRPYRVGMSCAFCHVSHHPLHPPDDPENPQMRNLSGTIGAQYFWFGRIFAPNVTPDNIVRHIVDSQQPGAVDTSFLPHDYIINPRAMNAVFDVPARLKAAERWHQEEMAGGALDLPEVKDRGPSFGVPHILWDGADSVGVDAALTRVYINIGEAHQEWLRHIRPLIGGKPQTPIEVRVLQENSVYWNATQERAANLAKYLIRASGPMRLKDAPDGDAHLQGDRDLAEYETLLSRGKLVFAEHCARCHSSKQPEGDPGSPEWLQGMHQMVMEPDFLEDNYLSTDARIAVTELETEICSSMASNAVRGQVWDNFSSETYKNLPAMGDVELYDPIRDLNFTWSTPGGGRGYQRVPSLIAIWSTAPLLHNNEIGKFTSDPSTAGRMEAFDDAIQKLLWPEKRENIIRSTPQVTYLKVSPLVLPEFLQPLLGENFFVSLLRRIFGVEWIYDAQEDMVEIGPIPKGTPVSLIGNINLDIADPRVDGTDLVKILFKVKNRFEEIHRDNLSEEQATVVLKELVPDLIKASACPDFIVDRGHYFGTKLPDEDKMALIEFVKTF